MNRVCPQPFLCNIDKGQKEVAMVTYSLNPSLFNIANDVMCTAEEQIVLGKLLLTCLNKFEDANIYNVPVGIMQQFEMEMYNIITITAGINPSSESFNDDLKLIDVAKRIDVCNALIKKASEFNFNVNVSTLKDFFGSCWHEMEAFRHYLTDKTRVYKKNLLLLGALSEALINVIHDFEYREDIYNDILSHEEIIDAVAEWLNGKYVFQFDEATIAALVNIVYVYTVPTAVEREALKLITDKY